MIRNAKKGLLLTGPSQEDLAAGGGRAATVAQPSGRREVRAAPDWPPVRIPGRPGWWRHCIDGQQTDLPTRDPADDRGGGAWGSD